MPKPYLHKIRKHAGLSQRELAQKLHIHHSNIVYWETSGRPPKSDLLLRMSKILGVNVEALLGVTGKKKRQTRQK